MENKCSECQIKIIIVGNSSVGKTNLVSRYFDDEFSEITPNTIGLDQRLKRIEIDNQAVKLQMWDTAGQEKYRSISSSFYKNSDGAILVYDIANIDSFQDIDTWLQETKGYTQADIQYLLIANKLDLENERQVESAVGQKYAQEQGLMFKEVSAKENKDKGVQRVFNDLLKTILQNKSEHNRKKVVSGKIKKKKLRDKNKEGFDLNKSKEVGDDYPTQNGYCNC